MTYEAFFIVECTNCGFNKFTTVPTRAQGLRDETEQLEYDRDRVMKVTARKIKSRLFKCSSYIGDAITSAASVDSELYKLR